MRDTFNEINITPLTDIFLVLLIIMMVIAPLLDQQGLNLTVPEMVSQEQIKDNNSKILSVTVTSDDKYYVDGKEVTDKDLEKTLTDLKLPNLNEIDIKEEVVEEVVEVHESKEIDTSIEDELDTKFTVEDVEIDDCVVSRKDLERLCMSCKMFLSGNDAEIKIPLELIVMDEFWRNFANFLKES